MTIKPPGIKTNPDREIAIPRALKKSPDQTPRIDTTPTPDKRKLNAQFKSVEFFRTIAQHGKHVFWRKALLCPCLVADIQQPDPTCTRCDGSGYYYVDPIGIQAIILTVEQKMNMLERAGAWMSGQAMVTVLPSHRLGFRDSLQMRDSIMTLDEYLYKGNRKGIRVRLPAGVDSARYRIVNVTYLHYLDRATNVLHTLEEGNHFTVDANGWIAWRAKGTVLVPKGALLSIRYEFHPAYVVDSHPHAIRDDFESKKSKSGSTVTALPLQAVVKLDYLVSDTPNDSNLPTTW